MLEFAFVLLFGELKESTVDSFKTKLNDSYKCLTNNESIHNLINTRPELRRKRWNNLISFNGSLFYLCEKDKKYITYIGEETGFFITPEQAKKYETKARELSRWITFINSKLQMLQDSDKVEFTYNIPEEFHSLIIEEYGKAGWIVTIEKTTGFNKWETTYNFTFYVGT